jgi:alanine racemase
MSELPLRESIAEVDLDAIASNTASLRDRSGVSVIAIVKADAYGHGAEATALACLDGGAEMLGVATVEEGLLLRRARLRTPILGLLGLTTAGEARAAVDAELHVAVWREAQLDMLDEAARTANTRAPVHLKVDTGLTRLGVQPVAVPPFARAIRRRSGLELAGIYTHLATSDELDVSFAVEQLDRFRAVLRALDGPPRWQHALATAGILAFGREGAFTAVRPGIGLYGLLPAPHLAEAAPLRPALTLRSRLIRVERVPPGTGVSYGLRWVAKRERVIGTVPFGYGDGLPRRASPGACMLVRGRAAPIVGRICMDLCMLDVSDIPDVREGDRVTIIGEDDGARRTADHLAEELDTINYEVVSSLHARVPRVYRRAGRIVATKTAVAGYLPT